MTPPPPLADLAPLINGFWTTQAIYVAAKLGLADLLTDGPLTATELAVRAGTQPAATHRLLRALASIGLFQEIDGQRFALTPLAERLRSDNPGSQRAMALMRGEWQYRAWGELLHCVQTGESAFEHLFGLPMFEFLAADPHKGTLFDAAMTSIHGRETSLMLDAYDFSRFGTVIDIGGGNGSLLSTVLQRHPGLRGVLFDLPAVIERAQASLAAADLGERCRLISGDFFDSVPAGADALLLRHIIHDWDDEQAGRILKNCRRAMTADATLLLAEFVIPPGNDRFAGKWFDLAMLIGPGGQERTAAEYERLLDVSGFKLLRIVSTAGEISLLEAAPVPLIVSG